MSPNCSVDPLRRLGELLMLRRMIDSSTLIFARKINSFDTAPKNLLPSDSRLRSDRYAPEKGDLSKAISEKISLEERKRAEERNGQANGVQFNPRWFDLTSEVALTPWGDLEVYHYNGKYAEHRAAIDCSECGTEDDTRSIEFNPWQFENSAAAI